MEITWSTLLMVQVCAFDILVIHLSDHLLANFIFVISFMFSRSLIIYSLFINLLVKMIFLNFTHLMFLSRTKPQEMYFLEADATSVSILWMSMLSSRCLVVSVRRHRIHVPNCEFCSSVA
jgi:hypothetical protein